jgi:hypothetical protein
VTVTGIAGSPPRANANSGAAHRPPSRLRVCVKGFRHVHLLDAACIRDRHFVGEIERLFLVMRDEDRGQAEPLVEMAQPAPEILAHFRIERAKRLVEQRSAGERVTLTSSGVA